MTRITISVSDDIAARLKREARRRQVAVSELVRSVLDSQLRAAPTKRLAFGGIGRSGSSGTSKRVDVILREEWADARRR